MQSIPRGTEFFLGPDEFFVILLFFFRCDPASATSASWTLATVVL